MSDRDAMLALRITTGYSGEWERGFNAALDEVAEQVFGWRDWERDADALPATPPASETVDAAWEALLDCGDDSHGDSTAEDIAHHRRRIEAAIRAECRPEPLFPSGDRAESDERVAALREAAEAYLVYVERQTHALNISLDERALMGRLRAALDAAPEDFAHCGCASEGHEGPCAPKKGD